MGSMAETTNALEGQMTIRASLHHYRLNQHFPNRIAKCELEMDQQNARAVLIVRFVNGHVVTKPEKDSQSSEFLALCGMLYDLPPKA